MKCKNPNHYCLYVVVSLIGAFGGVPRMGPRIPFALLPFGHYPIKYLKQNPILSQNMCRATTSLAVLDMVSEIIQTTRLGTVTNAFKHTFNLFIWLSWEHIAKKPRVFSLKNVTKIKHLCSVTQNFLSN